MAIPLLRFGSQRANGAPEGSKIMAIRPAGIQYIKRSGADFSAHLSRAAYRVMRTFHGDEESPVWWHVASTLIRTERPGGGDSTIPQPKRRVESGRADWPVLRRPAEEAFVEGFCRLLVRSRQFRPTEGTWSVFVDDGHVARVSGYGKAVRRRGRE